MATRSTRPNAPRRIETRWQRRFGAGLLVGVATTSCMLIDYEQLPEEGADLLAGSGGDSSSSPSGGSGGLPGIDVETDAGADDAGPGADDSGAPVCDPATYVADDSCGVGYCRSANQPSTCSAGVEQS